MKIGLCQIEVACGDREGNFGRIGEALQRAQLQGAQLAVFPESAVLGWINPDAHHQAHPIPGEDSDRLCEMARRVGIAMIVGIDEQSGGELYDSALAVSQDGILLGVHRKSNVLPELMDPPYAVGSPQTTIIEFDFARVGVLICADTFTEECIASAMEANLDLLAVPFGWVAEDGVWPSHGEELARLICRRARELGCPVVGVDGLGTVGHGPWMGRRYCGASLMADAGGNPLTNLQLAVPHITVAECRNC